MRALFPVLSVLTACAVTPAPPLTSLPGPAQSIFVDLVGRGDDGAPLRLHALADGPEDGDVVILLHGFPDFAWSWREVLPPLATDHRVYALDLRGYGLSAAPERGYDLFTVAADVEAFVDAVAPGRAVHLVGHDWGAAVGWITAAASPGRWRTFTAMDMPHGKAWMEVYNRSADQQRRSSYIGRLIGPDGRAWLGDLPVDARAAVYRVNLMRPAGFTDADAEHYHRAFGSRERMRAPIAYFEELVRKRGSMARSMTSAPPVGVPTLVLWGELDKYLRPEMAALSCEHVAAACEAEVWADLGHWLHWDAPDRVVARWRAFVATVQPGGPLAARAPCAGPLAPPLPVLHPPVLHRVQREHRAAEVGAQPHVEVRHARCLDVHRHAVVGEEVGAEREE